MGEHETKVATCTARLDQETGGGLMVRLEIKKLREQVKQLADDLASALDTGTLKEPAAPPLGQPRSRHRSRAARRAARRVDRYLTGQYPGYARTALPPCWPAHREALWELGNLQAEWQRIYGDPRGADLAAALWWHERWLPGVLTRLKTAIPCDEAGCTLQTRGRCAMDALLQNGPSAVAGHVCPAEGRSRR